MKRNWGFKIKEQLELKVSFGGCRMYSALSFISIENMLFVFDELDHYAQVGDDNLEKGNSFERIDIPDNPGAC